MKEDTKEYTLDDLEDIIREYSSQRLPELEKSDTVRMDKVNADTIRMDKVGADTVRMDKMGGDTLRCGKVGSDTIPLGGSRSDTVRLDRIRGGKGRSLRPRTPTPCRIWTGM